MPFVHYMCMPLITCACLSLHAHAAQLSMIHMIIPHNIVHAPVCLGKQRSTQVLLAATCKISKAGKFCNVLLQGDILDQSRTQQVFESHSCCKSQ